MGTSRGVLYRVQHWVLTTVAGRGTAVLYTHRSSYCTVLYYCWMCRVVTGREIIAFHHFVITPFKDVQCQIKESSQYEQETGCDDVPGEESPSLVRTILWPRDHPRQGRNPLVGSPLLRQQARRRLGAAPAELMQRYHVSMRINVKQCVIC